MVIKSLNNLKSYAEALNSHHVDNSTAIDTKPSNTGTRKIKVHA